MRAPSIASLAVGLVWVVGCMPDIPQDAAPPDRVQPVFDSQTETIPLPNDLALESDGTLPDLEGAGRGSAQGQFLKWLGRLHGWLPETTIEIPFDGELDPETLEEGVRLYELRTGGDAPQLEPVSVASVDYETTKVTVSSDGGEPTEIDGSVVRVVPENALEVRREYAVVVTKSVVGANGEPVLEPRPLFFAGSEEPLVDDEGRKTVDAIPDDETAEQLETLRRQLEPVFEGLADRDVSRSDVAMAFRWSTVREPRTVVDPADRRLPLPNTAALDDDGTFPDASLPNAGENTAQGYFESYLGGLHGWPPLPQEGSDAEAPTACAGSSATPEGAEPRLAICAPVDSALNPETVDTSSVKLWGIPEFEGDPFEVELDRVDYLEERRVVEIVPADQLPRQTRYVAFATDDVEGTNEYGLELPASLWMAIQPHPVLEDGSSTVDRLTDQQARQIAALRPFMQEAAELVEEDSDTTLNRLGAIWTWETWTDTFVELTPTGDNPTLPFPNEFVRRGDEGRVSLPAPDADDDGIGAQLIRELNERRGFSTTAGGWLPLNGPLPRPESSEEAPIPADSIQFWFRGQSLPQRYAPSRYELEYRREWDRVTFEPTRPWRRDVQLSPTASSTLNLGIVTHRLEGANGHPVAPSPAFVFLRSPHPLYDEETGESNVDVLSDEAAQTLEPARERFKTLFDAAVMLSNIREELGIEKREDIKMAWGFHPENSTELVQSYRALALEVAGQNPGRAAVSGPDEGYVDPANLDDSHPLARLEGHVAGVQREGVFETADFRGQEGRSLVELGEVGTSEVGVSIHLPEYEGVQDCSPPFDVVIAQHGLGSSRVAAGRALAPALADRCLATVTMDFPRHGGRTPNTSELHPVETPASSGEGFLTADVVAGKTNFVQGVVDLAFLAEIMRRQGLGDAIPAEPPEGGAWFDLGSDKSVGYVGFSLGGFVGTPLLAVDDNVRVGTMMAAGGGLSEVLIDGDLGGNIVDALEEAGIGEGTFGRYRARALLQWAAEPIDPLTFAPYLTDGGAAPNVSDPALEELTYEAESSPPYAKGEPLPANDLLLQMASGPESNDDAIVPNATTRRLAESAGVSLEGSIYNGSHGLFFNTDDGSEAAVEARCARRQAAAWMASGLADGREASVPDELEAAACRE